MEYLSVSEAFWAGSVFGMLGVAVVGWLVWSDITRRMLEAARADEREQVLAELSRGRCRP